MDYKDIVATVILIVVVAVATKFFPNSKLGSMTKYVKSLFAKKP